jgi:hypothetical protein
MSEVLVMYANQYRFADRETGELREGTSVTYFDLSIKDENGGGCPVLKANLSYDSFESIKGKVPGYFKTVIGKRVIRGKVQEDVTAFEFVRPFK